MANFKKKKKGDYQINRNRLKKESEWSIGSRTMSLKKTIINFLTQLRELKNGEL